jgi:GNAT superfamily N-acetyltransferase
MVGNRLGSDIRTCLANDVDAVTETLALAFWDGDLGPWLIQDRGTRLTAYRGYFRIFAEFWLEHGVVEAIDDLTAVALWLRVDDELALPIPDYKSRLVACVGSAYQRFVCLDETMHHRHPTGVPHDYLAFLAVRPARQGRGFGSALLRHRHTVLDAEGRAAYLEATGPRNRLLYARHSYRARQSYPLAASGRALTPMWREPAAHA